MLPAGRAPVGLDGDVFVVFTEPSSALLALHFVREEPDFLATHSTLGHCPLNSSVLSLCSSKKKLPDILSMIYLF
jgi:hypothetical protein